MPDWGLFWFYDGQTSTNSDFSLARLEPIPTFLLARLAPNLNFYSEAQEYIKKSINLVEKTHWKLGSINAQLAASDQNPQKNRTLFLQNDLWAAYLKIKSSKLTLFCFDLKPDSVSFWEQIDYDLRFWGRDEKLKKRKRKGTKQTWGLGSCTQGKWLKSKPEIVAR